MRLITTRKIPKHVIFPFGYKVSIRQLTKEQFAEMWGVPVRRMNVKAFYAIGQRTIYLRSDRRMALRRNDLIHELFHALVDYQNDMQYMKCVDVKGKK